MTEIRSNFRETGETVSPSIIEGRSGIATTALLSKHRAMSNSIGSELAMPTVVLDVNGQITLPREIREALGAEPGQRIVLDVKEGGLVEMRPGGVDLMSLYGLLKPRKKGLTLEDMEEAIRRGAAGD
ncbi:MAG TPA: AbrB/MazE/SpoVT family DNA-binding domain-containing protein [Thermoanaerobaculia bacterium]|jgi:AbrB family looped-hinge helix DNA binding protein|nr:AbrB/MazE/SpoVT family DNA-binding domain-containing protein [Thermoanaerobaculia bacterium]